MAIVTARQHEKSPPSPENRDNTFSYRLDALLMSRFPPLTQAELAVKSGINESTISRWRKSEELPSKRSLQKIAVALSTTVDWLSDGTGPMIIDGMIPINPMLFYRLSNFISEYYKNNIGQSEDNIVDFLQKSGHTQDDLDNWRAGLFPSNKGLLAILKVLPISVAWLYVGYGKKIDTTAQNASSLPDNTDQANKNKSSPPIASKFSFDKNKTDNFSPEYHELFDLLMQHGTPSIINKLKEKLLRIKELEGE
jgi:transcriptional regulator with XRE-family HTH domain